LDLLAASNLFGYSTKICKCLFHEDSVAKISSVESVDDKDICHAICLHPDFVNDPLLCIHRRQNRYCHFTGRV